jgi:ribosome production factor 2
MKRVLAFTSVDDSTIQVRHYEVPKITESSQGLEFKEIGPHFDLKLRRNQIASHDLYKIACKKPKITNMEKKKAKKNVYTTELGERKGKVYIQQQDLQTIATRKFKKQYQPKKKIEAEEV